MRFFADNTDYVNARYQGLGLMIDTQAVIIQLRAELQTAEHRIAQLEAALWEAERKADRAVDILRRATTLDHIDGCLFKADRRMPCQCGFNDKRNQLERDGRDFLRAIDAASEVVTEESMRFAKP